MHDASGNGHGKQNCRRQSDSNGGEPKAEPSSLPLRACAHRAHHTRVMRPSNTGSAEINDTFISCAVARMRRSKGSRWSHPISPARRHTLAEKSAQAPPCSTRILSSRPAKGAISGHFPRRTFCAISKKLMGLTRTMSESAIAARAAGVRRSSADKLQTQACVSSRTAVREVSFPTRTVHSPKAQAPLRTRASGSPAQGQALRRACPAGIHL